MALGTDRNAKSRSESWACFSSPAKQTHLMSSTSSLKLRFQSVKSWIPLQIIVTDVSIAGRGDETCHGTLFVCSIAEATNGAQVAALVRARLTGAPADYTEMTCLIV